MGKYLLLASFDYSRTNSNDKPVDVYKAVKEVNEVQNMSAMLYALVIVIGFYLILMAICWWVEYRNLSMGYPIFKWVTFGIGNAKALNLKKYIAITLTIYVALIMIITGQVYQMVLKIFIIVFRIPGWIMGTIFS